MPYSVDKWWSNKSPVDCHMQARWLFHPMSLRKEPVLVPPVPSFSLSLSLLLQYKLIKSTSHLSLSPLSHIVVAKQVCGELEQGKHPDSTNPLTFSYSVRQEQGRKNATVSLAASPAPQEVRNVVTLFYTVLKWLTMYSEPLALGLDFRRDSGLETAKQSHIGKEFSDSQD